MYCIHNLSRMCCCSLDNNLVHIYSLAEPHYTFLIPAHGDFHRFAGSTNNLSIFDDLCRILQLKVKLQNMYS